MILGLLKDLKVNENRVVLIPNDVCHLSDKGYNVLVESGAGLNAGFTDEEYIKAGAKITDKYAIFSEADVIVKVKELEKSEYDLLNEGQILFSCIHPAANTEEVDVLLDKGVISIAAEDTHRHGSPNCEAAGKVGALMGLYHLMTTNGGSGKFVSGLGGAPGIKALVLGCGTVGKGTIEILETLGADVSVAATNISHLREINYSYRGKVNTMISSKANIEDVIADTDLLVNCVRWDKSKTDFLITREMVASMQKGSVIVDISNDYGVIETFRETTFDNPVYEEEGVVHYCVSNIPSAIANTASVAYSAVICKHLENMIDNGLIGAFKNDGYLRRGLLTYKGLLTHEETSKIQERKWISPDSLLFEEEERESLDYAPNNTNTKSDLYYTTEEIQKWRELCN